MSATYGDDRPVQSFVDKLLRDEADCIEQEAREARADEHAHAKVGRGHVGYGALKLSHIAGAEEERAADDREWAAMREDRDALLEKVRVLSGFVRECAVREFPVNHIALNEDAQKALREAGEEAK